MLSSLFLISSVAMVQLISLFIDYGLMIAAYVFKCIALYTMAKKQNLNVVIDEDSFKECIKRMKTNNELDNEDMVLDDLQINKALDLIDKKAESIKK